MEPKKGHKKEEIKLSGDLDETTDVSFSIDDLQGTLPIHSVGTVDSLDPDPEGFNYTFNDLEGDKDLFEEDLRMKYPALQQAYDHYQAVKQMCETREKEEDENKI